MSSVPLLNLTKPGFSFGDVVEVLMKLFGIAPGKRDTFVGRLQQLQKAGIPAGANLGRGAKVRYNASQLVTLVACLDLLDCGVTPATLASYFGDGSDKNLEALFSKDKGNFGRPLRTAEEAGMELYFLFQPRALNYLQIDSQAVDGQDESSLLIDADIKVLDRINEKPSIVLNMTLRVRKLREAVEELFPFQAPGLDFK